MKLWFKYGHMVKQIEWNDMDNGDSTGYIGWHMMKMVICHGVFEWWNVDLMMISITQMSDLFSRYL